MVGQTLDSRYYLEQHIASGMRGELYLATDTTSGEMLAVHVFAPNVALRGEEGLRYLSILRRLKDVRHPHLLIPLKTIYSGGAAFQVLPYFPGVPLPRALQEASLSVGEAVVILRQITAALGEIHKAGACHFNIKPANVLVSREDGSLHAVLTDLARNLLDRGSGSSYAGRSASDSGEESIEDQFRAPELAPWLENTPDERSDLYSLGVLGFYMLTGTLPFPTGTTHQMIRHHLVSPVPDPRERNSRIPARLAAIVTKLMAKRPANRYAGTAGLLADLEHWAADGREPLGMQDRPVRFPCVSEPIGRKTTQQALLAALSKARAGQGSWLLLEGAEGSGRRSSLEELLGPVEVSQGLVLSAQAAPPGWAAPFDVPLTLLSSLLTRWPSMPDLQRRDVLHRLHNALGDNAGVLTAMMPALSALLPEAAAPSPLPVAHERARMLYVLTETFAAIGAENRPLVLWMDCIERADADSVQWMMHLLRRLPKTAILAVASLTEGRIPAASPLQTLIDGSGARAGALRLECPPLTAEQSTAQVNQLLGGKAVAVDPAIGDEFAGQLGAWLRGRWGGNPMAQEIAIRLLISLGRLTCDGPWPGGGFAWKIDWAAAEADELPENPAGLLARWLQSLDEGLLLLLEAAAVMPGPVAFDSLCAILDNLPPELIAQRLESALQAGVLIRVSTGFRFRHRAMREAMAQLTPEDRRADYHRVLAAFMEGDTQLSPLQRHYVTALHFKVAGDLPRFVDHGIQALHSALRHHALEGACVWAAPLLPRIGKDPRLAEVLLALGSAQSLLQRPAKAQDALGKFLGERPTDAKRMEALAWMARVEMQRGNNVGAIQHIRDALNLAGETLPISTVGTALARVMTGMGIRYESLRAAAAENLPAPSEQALRIAGLFELAALALSASAPHLAGLADEKLVRMLTGTMASPVLLRAMIRLGELQGHHQSDSLTAAAALLRHNGFPYERGLLHAAVGRCALSQCELALARDHLRQAQHCFQGLGDLTGQADVQATLFELERLQGSTDSLRRIAEEQLELCAATGLAGPGLLGAALAAFAAGLGGHIPIDEAVRRLLGAGVQIKTMHQIDGARYCHLLAGELLLAAGREGEALDIMQRVREGSDGSPMRDAQLEAAIAECHLVRAIERRTQRVAILKDAAGAMRRVHTAAQQWPLLTIHQMRLEAMLQLLQGKLEAGLATAEEARLRLESLTVHYPLALLYLRVGESLKSEDEEAWLRWCGRALSEFESLGALTARNYVRQLVEIDPLLTASPSTDAEPEFLEASGNLGSGHSGILDLIERLGSAGGAEGALWERDLLRALQQAADADRAALFLPNGEGALTFATALPNGNFGGSDVNRWLVDSVWQEGAGQLLDPYQPDSSGGDAGYPGLRSIMGIPLHSGKQAHGVVYLETDRRRLIYEQRDVERLTALGRQAGLALSLRGHLSHLSGDRDRAAEQGRIQQDLNTWTNHVAALESTERILTAYLGAPGIGGEYFAAALIWRDEQPTRVVCCVAEGHTPPDAASLPVPPLELHSSRAAEASASMEPVHLRGASGQASAPEELELLQRCAAEDGLWLPLLWDGQTWGLLLLMANARLAAQSAPVMDALMQRLRLITPALVAQREQQELSLELTKMQAALERERDWGKSLQRFLPVYLREQKNGALAIAETSHTSCPVLFGQIFGSSLNRLGRTETLGALQGYYSRIREALALHHGELSRILGPQWVAQFQGSPSSALFGVLTLNQMLLAFSDDQSANLVSGMGTGLGLHYGELLGGMVDAGDHVEPVLLGEGMQIAQRLAGMSITFRTGALVSEEMVQSLDSPGEFDLRSLGTYRMGPGEKRIGVFELFTMRESVTLDRMRQHHDAWSEAVREFRAGHWRSAAEQFQGYLAILPHDRPARHLLRQCRQRAGR